MCSCKVGPDYEPPNLAVAEQFDSTDAIGPLASDMVWWETFNDPVLTRCIEEALQANHDIQMAYYRVRSARAMRQMESSRFWPEIDVQASYMVDRLSDNNPRFGDAIEQGFFPRDVDYWDLGFDVTWELDVFGRTRRQVEASTARLEEQIYQRRALLLSIAAEVARNYVELRGHQARLQLLDEEIANATGHADILQQQQVHGLISGVQVLTTRAHTESLRSRQPPLQAEINASIYRLAVLMGRRPEDPPESLKASGPLPSALGKVPVGLPSELLERRPDVQAAERRLAAATADIGVAKSDYFPRFFLTGSPSLQSGDFSNLFSGASSAWIFGPSVNWKLFSGARTRAQVEAATEEKERLFVEYEATVNQVLKEVEESLVRYVGDAQSLERIRESAALQNQKMHIQQRRKRSGMTNELTVMEARESWLQAEQNRLDQQVRLLTRVVNLYKALGGGWEHAESLALQPSPR